MENRIGNGIENVEAKQKWVDETSAHSDSIAKFIKKCFINEFAAEKISNRGIKDYNFLTELRFLGSNIHLMARIQKGEIEPERINVLYNGDEAVRIDVLFDSNGRGDNIDVCLSGKALEDYLNKKEEDVVF